MASPEVLGISSGAAFGVVLMLFLVPGNAFGWLLPAGSLGAAVTLLIIMIAAGRGGFSPHRMLLAGMALSTAFTMLLMMLQASGDPRMAQVLTWISGSTYNATDAQVWRTGIVMVILLAITPLCRRWLTILPLGGDTARAVGMPHDVAVLQNVFLGIELLHIRIFGVDAGVVCKKFFACSVNGFFKRNLLAQCLRFVPEWQNYPETASVQQQNWSVLARAIERGINAPLASSCGRFFDVVAAALVEAVKQTQMIGLSPGMTQLKKEIEIVAASDLNVLISGETGTGKELVAKAIHEASPRAVNPLVYLNCAALPESVAESELFGHVKGAFTGAISNRSGKFEMADNGTLFLDEIGELSLALQAKLLRVLQYGDNAQPSRDV